MYSDFNILTQRPEHWGPVRRGPTVLRTERTEVKDPLCTMRSDSKGLFALNNELPQDDKKIATETPIIEEQMRRMHG
eukprot:10260073-Karenia_brevis.AAC.1